MKRKLPTRSPNQRLSAQTMAWFEQAVDHALFVVRRVAEHDYGVDYELEAVDDSAAVTNLRVQVQLKGTEKAPNQDGSISLSVAVENLNYLINGEHAVYVLADVPRHRLLFESAGEVLRQFEALGRDIQVADTVTVRFRRTFDGAAQTALRNVALAVGERSATARFGWGKLPTRSWGARALREHVPRLPVPVSDEEAQDVLMALLQDGHDDAVYGNRLEFTAHFPDSAAVANCVCLASVNLAMRGFAVEPAFLDLAVALWTQLLTRVPESQGGALYNLANALAALGRSDEALAAYRRSVELGATAECWKNLGSLLEDQGQLVDAERAFRSAIEIDPALPEAHFALACVLQARKDWQGSLRHLRIAEGAFTGRHRARLLTFRARAVFELGDVDEAVAASRQGWETTPEDDWCWRVVAAIHAEAWRKDARWRFGAERLFRSRLDKAPSDGDAWFELGMLLQAKHGFKPALDVADDVVDAYSRAIKFGTSELALACDRLGHLWEHLGRKSEALAVHERAATLDQAKFGYCYGHSLLANGRPEAALPWLRAAAEVHEPDALSFFNYATALAAARRPLEAEAAYLRSIALDRGYDAPRFDLGGLYWNLRRPAEAMATWREALATCPDSPRAEQVHLALMCAGLSL